MEIVIGETLISGVRGKPGNCRDTLYERIGERGVRNTYTHTHTQTPRIRKIYMYTHYTYPSEAKHEDTGPLSLLCLLHPLGLFPSKPNLTACFL